MYRPTRPDCGSCLEKHQARADLTKRVPPCKKCGKVALSQENYEVFGLIEKYSSTYNNGMGGISLSSIKTSLDLEEIPPEHQPNYTAKILSFLQTATRVSRSKT